MHILLRPAYDTFIFRKQGSLVISCWESDPFGHSKLWTTETCFLTAFLKSYSASELRQSHTRYLACNLNPDKLLKQLVHEWLPQVLLLAQYQHTNYAD